MSRSMGSGTPACVECFVILGLGELEVTLLEMLKVASSGSGQQRVGQQRHR